MKKTIIHRVMVLFIVVACFSFLSGFLCSKAEEVQSQLEEGLQDLENFTVLGQRDGFVDVDGPCDEVGEPVDAPIRNDYLGTTYDAGQIHTFECDVSDPTDLLQSVKIYGNSSVVCVPDELFGIQLPFNPASFSGGKIELKEAVIGSEAFGVDLDDLIGVVAPELAPADRECVDNFPAPCPFLENFRQLGGLSPSLNLDVVAPYEDTLNICLDNRNNPPPVVEGSVVFDSSDGDVLRIEMIELACDFESKKIMLGYHDGTAISEGYLGGSYANLHYVVVPWVQDHTDWMDAVKAVLPTDPSPNDYDEACVVAGQVSQLMQCAFPAHSSCTTAEENAYNAWQDLLAEAIEGSGGDRTEGLVPFNHWSKNVGGEPQCEVFDSVNFAASQNRKIAWQTANFGQTLGVYDLTAETLAGSVNPCVTVFLYEGDGTSTTEGRNRGLIGPTDYADDLVMAKKVCYDDVAGGSTTFVNFTGDVWVTMSLGSLDCP